METQGSLNSRGYADSESRDGPTSTIISSQPPSQLVHSTASNQSSSNNNNNLLPADDSSNAAALELMMGGNISAPPPPEQAPPQLTQTTESSSSKQSKEMAPEMSMELVPFSSSGALSADSANTNPALSQDDSKVDETAMVPANNNNSSTSNLHFVKAGAKLQLHEREKEIQILRDEYDNMMKYAKEDTTKARASRKLTSVVCIAGKAGTGKTVLAKSLAYYPRQTAGTYFMMGKCPWPTTSVTSSIVAAPYLGEFPTSFDATQMKPSLRLNLGDDQERTPQQEPLSAFAMALDHLWTQLEAQPPTAKEGIRSRVRQALGNSGIGVMAELSPQLAAFLSVTTQSSEANGQGVPTHVTTTPTDVDTTKSEDVRVDFRLPRLKYVLREFFRALSAEDQKPCVFILDDAQWADQDSLELARHIHADAENPCFMLILTWRTNDIHEEESCYTAVGSSIGVFADDLVRRINLQHLTEDGVELMTAEALQMPASDVKRLAEVIFDKTYGNPFFVKQYMESLEEEYLIRYSSARKFWRWDEEKVEASDTSVSANELIRNRLRKLSMQSLTVIKVLSAMGLVIDEPGACAIIHKMDTVELFDVEVDGAQAHESIQSLIRTGFLERFDSVSKVKFSHDQIQESAFSLIPKDSRPLLQLRVGERLLEAMEEHGSDNVSFLGVDLCSKGIAFLSSKERMGLALYNLLAGEKCMGRASFSAALAYFEYGLSALRISEFLKGRLSLELSFGAMEAAFCVDDYDKVRLHYDRITGSGSNSDDKIRAHVLMIRATGTRGDAEEAIATGYRVLRSIGVKTILEMSNKVSLFVQLQKTKMALRKQTEDTLANLKELSGVKLKQAMRVVEAMLPFAYTRNRQLFMHLVMKSVRWAIKYGVCEQSALAFAALGSFPAFQGMDMSLATIVGQAALRLMERFGTSDYPGMVMFLVNSQILNWTSDLPVVQKNLDRTHRVSMQSGDALSAFCSLAASYLISYEAGNIKLEQLEILGDTYSRRIRETKSDFIAWIHDTTWQTVLNLRGENFDPTELSGRAIKNQDEAILLARTSGNDLLEFMVLSRQVQLSYLMGQHDRAESYRTRSDATVKSIASSPHLVSHTAYCALNCLALCASNSPGPKKNSSPYKTATKLFKKLHHWHDDQGYRHCRPLIYLIQGEIDRVNGNFMAAEKAFESALTDLEGSDNYRETGLAHELLGRLFLRDQKDESWAAHHFDHAMQHFNAWGATALVNKLLDQYGDVLPENPGQSEVSVSLVAESTKNISVV